MSTVMMVSPDRELMGRAKRMKEMKRLGDRSGAKKFTSKEFILIWEVGGTDLLYGLHFTHFSNKSTKVDLVIF